MVSEKQIIRNNIYDLNFVHYEQKKDQKETNESHPIVINVGKSYTAKGNTHMNTHTMLKIEVDICKNYIILLYSH